MRSHISDLVALAAAPNNADYQDTIVALAQSLEEYERDATVRDEGLEAAVLSGLGAIIQDSSFERNRSPKFMGIGQNANQWKLGDCAPLYH
jgi:hypothetical protein